MIRVTVYLDYEEVVLLQGAANVLGVTTHKALEWLALEGARAVLGAAREEADAGSTGERDGLPEAGGHD